MTSYPHNTVCLLTLQRTSIEKKCVYVTAPEHHIFVRRKSRHDKLTSNIQKRRRN